MDNRKKILIPFYLILVLAVGLIVSCKGKESFKKF